MQHQARISSRRTVHPCEHLYHLFVARSLSLCALCWFSSPSIADSSRVLTEYELLSAHHGENIDVQYITFRGVKATAARDIAFDSSALQTEQGTADFVLSVSHRKLCGGRLV